MQLDFAQVIPSIPFILGGIWVTLKYMLVSIAFGFTLGLALCLCRISKIRSLSYFAQAYSSVFRGTPLLVQLYLIYYGIPKLTGFTPSAFTACAIAFSLNSGAYMAEVLRSGIQSIDRGQFEAFRSLGISYRDGMKGIILPQALRNILPSLINEMINLLKESSIVSVIGEMDLLRRANMVAAEKLIYFEPLLIIAAVYYILVMILTMMAQRVEKWMARHDQH